MKTKKQFLVVGGSLGAKSINEAIDKGFDELLNAGLQIDLANRKTLCSKSERTRRWKNCCLGK